ncbi:MAG TPA: hypothetical protein VMM12_01780 [Longimicrobiales bacterium]|nr:hypothetical protein [Longimicrobiales bacterium]
MGSFTADERRRIEAALAAGREPLCPACGGVLDRRRVRPAASVSYVRRREWLLCPGCRRSGAVDVREGERP